MTDHTTTAQQIGELLDQLHTEVTTREQVPRYRKVRRGHGREVAVIDFAVHRTRAPGLLTQLGINDGHGAAVPSRSPGWDDDGALSPMARSGRPEAAEPVNDAWHVADGIRRDLDALTAELHAEGHTGSFIDIALDDEHTGHRIARRLRALVARARIAAAYDAPVVPLRDVCCPECGGQLHVRADASSAVWCTGAWTIEGPALTGEPWPVRVRCGATWPRGSWVKLLEEATREAG